VQHFFVSLKNLTLKIIEKVYVCVILKMYMYNFKMMFLILEIITMKNNFLIKSLLCIFIAVIVFSFSGALGGFATEEEPTQTTTTTTTPSPTTTTTTPAPTTTTTTPSPTTTTTTPSQTTTTTPTTTKKTTTTTVKKSLAFKKDNTTNVAVSRSIVLYITSTGINDLNTEFSCNDTTTATVLKINDSSVRVFGLKDGVVTVYATSGDLQAKIKITVGKGEPTATTTTTTPTVTSPTVESIPDNILLVSSDDDTASDEKNTNKKPMTDAELFGDLKTEKKLNAATVITGIVWWGIILVGVVAVTLVILNNNTGAMKLKSSVLYSYKRAGKGGYRSYNRYSSGFNTSRYRRGGKNKRNSGTRKHLLPDHYYRHLRKW